MKCKKYNNTLESITSYLRDIISDPRKSGKWKISLAMKMKFMASKYIYM